MPYRRAPDELEHVAHEAADIHLVAGEYAIQEGEQRAMAIPFVYQYLQHDDAPRRLPAGG